LRYGIIPADFHANRHNSPPTWKNKLLSAKNKLLSADSEPRTGVFALQYAQLLAQGKDLKADVVPRTEIRAEAAEKADEK